MSKTNESKKVRTKTMGCKCKHEYQDEKYGKGVRVHNMALKKNGDPKWRCTVCGAEK